MTVINVMLVKLYCLLTKMPVCLRLLFLNIQYFTIIYSYAKPKIEQSSSFCCPIVIGSVSD